MLEDSVNGQPPDCARTEFLADVVAMEDYSRRGYVQLVGYLFVHQPFDHLRQHVFLSCGQFVATPWTQLAAAFAMQGFMSRS